MKTCLKVAGAAFAALVCLGASAEVVRTKERTYLVKYKDGVAERYKVVWTANFATTLRDQGGSYVPYQGAVETRRCSWTITSTIDRTVALATRLGPTVPLPALSRTLPVDQGTDSVVTGTVDETCKDSAARREGQISATRSAMLAAFDRLTDADLAGLKREGESKPDVASITIE